MNCYGTEATGVGIGCLGSTGKPLPTFIWISSEDLDYEALKVALFSRFRLAAEGSRERFQKCKPEDAETGAQFATWLGRCSDRWIAMTEAPRGMRTSQAV